MKAARLRDVCAWEIVDIDEPVPRAGQMLVRLEQVAVCGSDVPDYLGVHPGFPKPTGGTGHEGIGRVVSCPSGTYVEGERVLLWGFDRDHGLFQEAALTVDEGLLRLPGDALPERVLMSQLLGTVIRPFRKIGNVIHQRAAIIGLVMAWAARTSKGLIWRLPVVGLVIQTGSAVALAMVAQSLALRPSIAPQSAWAWIAALFAVQLPGIVFGLCLAIGLRVKIRAPWERPGKAQ